MIAFMSNGPYRDALKAARQFWRNGKPKPKPLHAAISAAANQVARWWQAATDGSMPHLPSDLAGIVGVFGQFYSELQALASLAGGTGLTQLSIPALQGRLQAMLNDTPMLFKLPEFSRCRMTLNDAGLTPLIKEITERQLSIDHALDCADHVWLSSILEFASVTDPRDRGLRRPVT